MMKRPAKRLRQASHWNAMIKMCELPLRACVVLDLDDGEEHFLPSVYESVATSRCVLLTTGFAVDTERNALRTETRITA